MYWSGSSKLSPNELIIMACSCSFRHFGVICPVIEGHSSRCVCPAYIAGKDATCHSWVYYSQHRCNCYISLFPRIEFAICLVFPWSLTMSTGGKESMSTPTVLSMVLASSTQTAVEVTVLALFIIVAVTGLTSWTVVVILVAFKSSTERRRFRLSVQMSLELDEV
jgi:hypothetical protein